MEHARERIQQGAAAAVGEVGKVAVVASFAMNLVFGSALSEIFALIGKLSLMVHLFIANVKIPPNAQNFFGGLFGFITFNLIDLEDHLRRWFSLNDDIDFNPNMYYLGYHSIFFTINIGNMLLVILYDIG